ncbi:MAG: hypothetical protein ACREMY_23890 [bacterium]
MVTDAELGRPLQLEPLLAALDRHGVDFVVVGGVAGLAHGSAYPTYDLDVAYARDEGNLRRLAAALRELGVTLRGAPADLPFQIEAATLAAGANFTFDSTFGMFDVLGDFTGVRNYAALRADSRVEQIKGLPVRIASLDHLITMKRSANRPKDRNMVEEYIVIADEQQRQAEGKDD